MPAARQMTKVEDHRMLKYAIIGTATRATLPMLSTTCCPCIMKSTHTCTPDAERQTSSNALMSDGRTAGC